MTPGTIPPAASNSMPSAGPTSGAARSFSIAQLAAVLFLASQLIFILVSRYSNDTWRTLTPINGLTQYDIHATLAQHALAADEIERRYGIPAAGEVALQPDALQAVIAHCENPIPLSRAVIVRLHTRRPNGSEEIWLWPQQ